MANRGPAVIPPLRVCLQAAVLVALACLPARAQSLQAQPFATGLSFPVAFLGDPTAANRHFVVEQTGRIRVLVDGILQPAAFLDLSGAVLAGGERGLLGMALDPQYSSNRRFYLFFTRAEDPVTPDTEAGDIVIARFMRSAANPLAADPASRFDLRWGSPAGPAFIEHSQFSNHNGGNLMFGPDGYLYIGTGDGGGSYDPYNSGQRADTLLGKILRIDVNVATSDPQGYQIPPDNPFVDDVPIDALPEIWDFGMRNPWRFSFDDPSRGGSGALIIADVGQNHWEEINYEPPGQGGRNYGWRIREGMHPEVNAPATTPAFGPLTEPVYEYSHVAGETPIQGASITGGFVYRGSDLSATWRGRYFFGDFASARTWSAQVNPTTGAFSNVVDHTPAFGPLNMSSFGVDDRGELYIVRYGATNNGAIYRLCEVSVAAGVTLFSAAGGAGTLTITTGSSCVTTVSGGAPWITLVSDATAPGPRTLVFRVLANPGGRRTADLAIAGQVITITQTNAPPVPGDFDNNGTPDLVWQHADGRIALWSMLGSTLISAAPLGPGSIADVNWRIAATGDFDRDGSLDVVFQHQTDGRLAVWFLSGNSLLSGDALTPSIVPDVNWKIRGAADVDRDGWPDLLWQHEANGSIAVWLMTGTRLRDAHLLTPGTVSLDWRIVGAADVNRDGDVDLVWQNQTNGLIATWLMNGSTSQSAMLLSPGQVGDTNWKIRAVGDMNGDGWIDLIWRHQGSGDIAVWLMNGTRLVSALYLTPPAVSDTNWQIAGPR